MFTIEKFLFGKSEAHMQEIEITKMTRDDLEAVYEIDKDSFPVPWSKTSFEEELKNMLATYFVAKLDGKVVGYIGMWLVVDECHITNIAVQHLYHPLSYRLALNDNFRKNLNDILHNNPACALEILFCNKKPGSPGFHMSRLNT